MAPEQPTFPGSPRSSLSKAAKPLARTSESNSEENLSTATTAVDSRRSSNSEILSGIVSKLDRTEQTQAGIMKKMETVDSATTIRLSDSREHVDKKFERNERSMDVAFDEVWEKVGLNNLEMKQSEGYIEWARSKKDSPKRRCGSRYWAKEEKERGIRYMEFYV